MSGCRPASRPDSIRRRTSSTILYGTHLRAPGIDDADLALVAGHTVETMVSVYTHALEKSHDTSLGAIR